MTKKEARHLSEVLKAYSEGKTIQIYDRGKWNNCDGIVHFNAKPEEYRIKPELKLRPYKNAEEFLQAQKEHGPYLHNSYGYIIPIGVYDNAVIVLIKMDTKIIFEVLKNGYTWQDGTLCGIMEE